MGPHGRPDRRSTEMSTPHLRPDGVVTQNHVIDPAAGRYPRQVPRCGRTEVSGCPVQQRPRNRVTARCSWDRAVVKKLNLPGRRGLALVLTTVIASLLGLVVTPGVAAAAPTFHSFSAGVFEIGQ